MKPTKEMLTSQNTARWFASPEYETYAVVWMRRNNPDWLFCPVLTIVEGHWNQSAEFRQARLAYRRRINNSPNTETT